MNSSISSGLIPLWYGITSESDPDPKSCAIQKQNSGMIHTPLNGGGAFGIQDKFWLSICVIRIWFFLINWGSKVFSRSRGRPVQRLSAVSTVSFVSIRENWLRSASVLRPLSSSAARALSFFSSIICLSPLLE